ncbi:hypothetical protein CL645_03785 [bacterium]|nr:hypothetical protein [bacterium]
MKLDHTSTSENLKQSLAKNDRRKAEYAKALSRLNARKKLIIDLLNPELTMQQAALLLGVSHTTIRRDTEAGILRCHRTAGNQRRFKLLDLLAYMDNRNGYNLASLMNSTNDELNQIHSILENCEE